LLDLIYEGTTSPKEIAERLGWELPFTRNKLRDLEETGYIKPIIKE